MKLRVLVAAIFILALAAVVFAQSADGTWTGEQQGGRRGPQQLALTLKASGASLTGTLKTGTADPVQIEEGKVDGGSVTFKTKQTFGENSVTVNWSGKIAGDDLTLTRTVEGGGGGGRGGRGGGPQEVTLKRQK